MKPYLHLLFLLLVSSITASAQPCTGQPTAGTITAYPSSACLSSVQPIYLVVTGYSTGPGINLQWEESPCGINNPWTPIAGATSDTLVINPIWYSNCTIYRVMITCLNSSQFNSTFVVLPLPSPANCQDSVWPGDVNYDLITNNFDALDLATVIGSTGHPRDIPTISYTPQFCFDWNASFVNNINIKNADCDGNGMVDLDDTLAIFNNYGLVHAKGASTPRAKVTADPDLYFDITGLAFTPGTSVSVPIKLGTTATPMNNIYGLAASIKMDNITPATAPFITYSSSWLGAPNNTLRFSKAINNTWLDWTYARTDHQNNTGGGTIAQLNFTIPVNAAGDMILSFDNVKMIDSAGQEITAYNIITDTVQITPLGLPETPVQGNAQSVVPNPSGSEASLHFTLTKGQEVSIRITDIMGKTVWHQTQYKPQGVHTVNLPASSFAPGLYMVQISRDGQPELLKWIKK